MESSSLPVLPQIKNKPLNIIPVGRQLQRTPPSKNLNIPINYKSEQPSNTTAKPSVKEEYDAESVMEGVACSNEVLFPSVKEERKSSHRSNTMSSTEMDVVDTEALVQGMRGYQWTEADLEFVHQAGRRKRFQQLQRELSDAQKTLKDETQRLELSKATRDKLRRELSETLSCEVLLRLCRDVLSRSQAGEEQGDVGPSDGKLLSQLRMADVQQAIRDEVAEVTRLQGELAAAQELREEEEQTMKEMANFQRKTTKVKENIKALKVSLTELKSQLSENEKALLTARPQEKACRAPRTIKARGTSDAAEAQKEKNPKAKTRKGTKMCLDGVKEPTEQNLQPAETEGASKTAQALDKAPKASKTAKSPAAAAASIPKASEKKAPKEKALKDKAMKEKSSKDITTVKESPTVPQGPENAHKAAKPGKALLCPEPSESDAGPLRRSKRIAMKNQVPQKTACSRKR